MVLATLTVQKSINNYYYTNDYHLELTGTLNDQAVIDRIVLSERQIHTVSVNFVSTRLKLAGSPHGYATITPLTGTGNYTPTTAQDLPLYNTVRVDFGPVLGPLGRKYLRVGLREDMVYGTVLETAYRDYVQLEYVNPLADLPQLVTIHGQSITRWVLKTQVQMRQMRRGSKRRARPVIPTA